MVQIRRSKYFRFLKLNPRRFFLQGLVFLAVAIFIFCISYFAIPGILQTRYEKAEVVSVATGTLVAPEIPTKKEFTATHIATPTPVKAIYMTSWVAGSKALRDKLINLIDITELNSIVIDIKDYTGRISFEVEDPYLKEIGAVEKRIPDIRSLIATLHQKNIYVIGRISVFQDPHLVKVKPEFAVRRASDGLIWKDYKGISWLDASSKDVWNYTVALGKESYKDGFDELNFDYIRFPSDGNMKDIQYLANGHRAKSEVLKDFFSFLRQNLNATDVKLSADLFGMTTTNKDDLNIGQMLEYALQYFDFVSPMVYPSHYPPSFMGFANPADKPYEVVKFSMDSAVRRAIATSSTLILADAQPISTSTKPFLYRKESFDQNKLRPWLQDFNLGATYTPAMVRAQISATYDAGLDSWMLWNAGNRYTKEALLAE